MRRPGAPSRQAASPAPFYMLGEMGIPFLLIKKKKNHYLFLPVLGLHCYTWAFFSCSKQGVFFVAVCRASHCGGFLLWSMGSGAQPQELLGRGSVAPWHVGSSWTRDGTRVPPYSQADS